MAKILYLVLVGIALAGTQFEHANVEPVPKDEENKLVSQWEDDIGQAAAGLLSAGVEVAHAMLDCAFSPSKCAEDIGNIGSDLATSSKQIEAALKDCDNISSKWANEISATVGSLS